MAISFKGAHFPQEIILTGVRWYVAYPLSYRHVEELMAERGVAVDHATIQRWVVKYSPLLEAAFHRRKRPVWVSWRMDETYIRVKGEWKYLYRVVDKYGQTIDFLLTEHRDKDAALRFLKKAIRRNGVPETITIDGSDANEAAIKSYNQEYGTAIAIRQVKYFNNIVEIVFTQLIKMSGLTTGRGWNDVAYLHLTMVDEHTIDQEFSQGCASAQMWLELIHSGHAAKVPRWTSPCLPAFLGDRLGPPAALPGLPRLAVSGRGPGAAADTRLRGSPPADTPWSSARAAGLTPSARGAASLCAPVMRAVTRGPHGLALRHIQSTPEARGVRTSLATPGHRVGPPGWSARGSARRMAHQAFALNASIGRSAGR